MLQGSSSVLSACCCFGFFSQLMSFPVLSLCQREEEKEETRLSEEAERSFDQLQSQEDEDEPITMTDPAEESATAASPPDVSYQIENENQVSSSTIRVPAIVTAT